MVRITKGGFEENRSGKFAQYNSEQEEMTQIKKEKDDRVEVSCEKS